MKQNKILLTTCLFIMTGCSSTTVEYEDPVYSYSFDVYQELDGKIEDKIDIMLDSFVTDKQELFDGIDGQGHIDWSVISGRIEIIDNVIHKSEDASDNEPITLKAHYVDENNDIEYICKPNICLDEYAGYVLSYFVNKGKDSQTLKIAYSYDGFLWFEVDEQQSIYKPTTGTTYLRDPSFIRLKEGGFKLVATEGWDNPNIYVLDTKDFINYSNEQLVQVNKSHDDLPLKESQAWAPEGFYDYVSDTYYIYYSSVDDEKILYNTTNDFKNYSKTNVLIDLGYPVIDATIFKDGGHYYILLKDEREPMEDYSYLFIGSSDSDFLHFNKFSDAISRHQAEGPFILQDSYHTVMYYDDYTRSQYEKMVLDPKKGTTEIDDTDSNIIAFNSPSHGSLIRVTWDEMQEVIAHSN